MRRGLGLHESRWEGEGRHSRRRHSLCKRLSCAGLRRWAGEAERGSAGGAGCESVGVCGFCALYLNSESGGDLGLYCKRAGGGFDGMRYVDDCYGFFLHVRGIVHLMRK